MEPRMKIQYNTEIAPSLMKKFGYKSVMQIPKLDKVVINVGCGESKNNAKEIEAIVKDLGIITGQKAVICKARKSVANFKLREGENVGVKVTLRGAKMYEFLDRLFSVALPRVRDFRGINPNSFDGRSRTEEYRKGIVQLTSLRLCSNALAQLVIPAALADCETPAAMVRPGGRLYEQRQATIETLDKIEGISYVKNVAAFYLFPKLDVKKFNITNDKQFARDLLTEAKILIVPGSGFDWPDPDHFRIVMLPEAGELRAAMERMGAFLDGYKQK